MMSSFKNSLFIFIFVAAAALSAAEEQPQTKKEFSVTLLSNPYTHIRKAERYLEEKGVYEEILDNGRSNSIEDLDGVTWRNFRTTVMRGEKEEVTVGAVDLPTKKKIILRKMVSFPGEKGREICVFDVNGKLISANMGTAKQASFDDVSAFLGGQLAQHTLRSSHVVTFFRDLLGSFLDQKDGTLHSKRDARGCVSLERSGRKFLFKRDLFGRVTEIIDSEGSSYQIDYDALDRMIEVRGICNNSWSWSRTISVDGTKIITILTQDREKDPYMLSETRRENGLLLFKKEEMGREAFLYEFDEKGRVLYIDHEQDGKKHRALTKTYASFQRGNGEVRQEKTIYADQTSLIEETTSNGQRARVWLDAAGKEVLREDVETLDENGSMRLKQQSGKNTRTLEWIFGANKRLLCMKEGDVATEYFYDNEGRLIAKKAPLHTLYYTWKGKSLAELLSDDGTIDYLFSYDAQGRMTKVTDVNSSKSVVRSFDDKGRLVSDGEEGRLCLLSYENHNVLSEIRLPDGSLTSFQRSGDSWRVQRGEWSAQKADRQASLAPMCCRKTVVKHEDPHGEWVQEVSYDSLGQLSGEKGEFNQEYSFSPFGSLESCDGKKCVMHDNEITYGDAYCALDKDGSIISREQNGEKKEFLFDALGRVVCVRWGDREERYRYDALSRLQEITFWREGVIEDHKELLWVGETEIGSMEEGALSELKITDPSLKRILGVEVNGALYDVEEDDHGSITILFDHVEPKEVYRYNAFGALRAYGAGGGEITPKSPWLYSGKRYLPNAGLYDFGPRRYDPITMRWCEKDPLGFVDGYDARIFAKNDPVSFSDPTGLLSFPIDWTLVKDGAREAMQRIVSSTWKSITLAKGQLDWFCEVRDEFENITFRMLGKKWMQLIGYNPDMSMARTCGTEEKNPKVRLTFINGILNSSCDSLYSANLVSETHGGNAVHYVYVATSGFTSDVLCAAAAQAGVLSYQAKLLADMWKKLIVEMGGVNGGGMILHYAHSLGATDTVNALKLLTPQERSIICVTTFGGSTLIWEGLCGKVDNYISTKDGVPVLDLGGYISSSLWERPGVHFLPSESSLLFDHLFAGKTYRTVLELLGHEFQEKYLLTASNSR